MASLNFDIAVNEADEADEIIEFTINGEGFLDGSGDYESHVPTPNQLALLLSAEDVESYQALRRFFKSVLLEDSFDEIFDRISDDEDPLQFTHLNPIARGLLKARAGFPTESPSDSSPSPAKTGRATTDHLPKKGSTRSSSTRAASSTRSSRSVSKA